MNFKNKIRRCEKNTDETEIFDAKLQTYEYIEQHCINISIKHRCNVIMANIDLLEHVGLQCTCMSDSPKMSIPKFKYKLQTCKIKSSKLSSLIDSFRPFINQTCIAV